MKNMTEEHLDIVDENNNLTGEKKPRSLVHATGLWHRIVNIYFFRRIDNNIDFLVHLRAKTKDLYPNCWDTRFGGHVKSGRDIEYTALNEIKDEVGLEVSFDNLIKGSWRKNDEYPNNEFNQVYYFEFKGVLKDLKFDDGEVQKVKWLSIDEIEKSMNKEPNIWAEKAKDFRQATDFLEAQLKGNYEKSPL
jgi:isopentenyldiphosphate isomerase|tara:strand:+ start:985 stop:1557 length:573 start_codon:yes stop_codon:yes gene_type:complete